MKKIIFKGGSLSETCLIIDEDGNSFVRKSVSLIDNRVYGYQRWYSQLKRIQRYSVLYPDIFPRLIKYGKDGNTGYFDIEYYDKGVNAQEYIEKCIDKKKIDLFFNNLIETMGILHVTSIQSNCEAMDLYIYEEIEQKINDCYNNELFMDFIKYDEIIFNGSKVNSFLKVLDKYKTLCRKYYVSPKETFTHGNITLENLLFFPENNKFIFIDPYEENIIDSKLAEFSQLLQSSNGKYEVYNRHNDYLLNGNEVAMEINESYGLNYLNNKLIKYLKDEFSENDYYIIRLLEISQFIRMLPFKMEVDENKMIFFYSLASKLFCDLLHEINSDI